MTKYITPHGRATVSTLLIEVLRALGLRHAFGIIGAAIVPFYDALCRADVELVHFRHENGAVFAAIEASLAADVPALAFTTTAGAAADRADPGARICCGRIGNRRGLVQLAATHEPTNHRTCNSGRRDSPEPRPRGPARRGR